MQVVMIGTGNVAAVLSKLIVEKGHRLVEVAGRNHDHALRVAGPLGAKASKGFSSIGTGADIYIIAVTDDAIAGIVQQLGLRNKLIIHTAGAASKHLLQSLSNNYGVMWPLQTLRRETGHVLTVPLVVDGSNEVALKLIETFAQSLSPMVSRANDEERAKLHVSAVVVSNFTNHLYALAAGYCKKENLDFNLLLPLVQETAQRIQHHSPREVQTGPAVRSDKATMGKHVGLLKDCPNLQLIYKIMSDDIGRQ